MNYDAFRTDEGERGLNGVRVGIVTNNQDPDGIGRVKLRFPWRDADDESVWARIATPLAGDGMGTYALPDVDDEVLVAFEGGDIHEPYVLGSLWNGQAKPPADNDDGDNTDRLLVSRSGHRFAVDETDDGGGVTIETAGGHTVDLDDGGETITITDSGGSNSVTFDADGGSISITGDQKLSLSAGQLELSGSESVSISGQSVSIDADSDGTVSSSGQLEVSSEGMLDVKSTGMMSVQSSAILTIKGSLIQLN